MTKTADHEPMGKFVAQPAAQRWSGGRAPHNGGSGGTAYCPEQEGSGHKVARKGGTQVGGPKVDIVPRGRLRGGRWNRTVDL